jgi:hypothetical protein
MLVTGTHVAQDGIINDKPNSSLQSGDALHANLPAYEHDSWATAEIYERLRHLYPYDKQELAIADLIDTIGTMRALKVERIAVRR